MIIVALADIHGNVDFLPAISDELAKADLVLIAGDITHFGGSTETREILEPLRQYQSNILAVAGNCDRESVNDYLDSEGINLDRNCVNINGVTFAGLGGSLPCPGKTPNESGEDEFFVRLKQIESKIPSDGRFVLVTHQPAAGTIVDTIGQQHTGSTSIRDFIETYQPLLAISAHIHEAVGVDRIGQTTLINPGPFRSGKYAYLELDEEITNLELKSI